MYSPDQDMGVVVDSVVDIQDPPAVDSGLEDNLNNKTITKG